MPANKSELNEIAKTYHLSEADFPDMFIENACQKFELSWIKEQIPPPGRVLELGYGDGIMTEALVDADYDLSIVEGSDLLIHQIKKKYQNQINIFHDLFEEFHTSEQYDYIIASHVLEHIDNPVFLLQKYKEFLKEEGKLIIFVPNKESIHRQIGVIMKLHNKLDDLSERDKIVGHKRVYSIKTLTQDIKSAGYQIINQKGFFLKTVANSMMLTYSEDLILALNKVASLLPDKYLANIGMVIQKVK